MTRFLIRRSAQALVVLILVTIIVFGLCQLLPGGPARAILGTHATPTTSPPSTGRTGWTARCPRSTGTG